jgi:DNA-binding NarL/FixJ family response regulator
VASRTGASDPRVDIALRHRIIRAGLTAHEAEVLVVAVNGVPRSHIARKLGIAENTIKTHVNVLMRKLGAVSLDAAVNDVLRAALEVSLQDEMGRAQVSAKRARAARAHATDAPTPPPKRRRANTTRFPGRATSRLLGLLQRHPKGLSIGHIAGELRIDKQHARRMLELLLRTGEAIRRGEKRGTRYLLRRESMKDSSTASPEQTNGAAIG